MARILVLSILPLLMITYLETRRNIIDEDRRDASQSRCRELGLNRDYRESNRNTRYGHSSYCDDMH